MLDVAIGDDGLPWLQVKIAHSVTSGGLPCKPPARMDKIRQFFKARPAVAVLLIALALAMKVLVPAGYMLSPSSKYLTVLVCSGTNMDPVTINIPMAPKEPGTGGHDTAGKDVCSFSALAHAGLAAADPVLLAAAILFILALGFLPVPPGLRAVPTRLRPPLRGPPLTA
ncbi:MAG TPA: DUF2946 family protein [Rhodospirillales bacterium]